MKTFKEYIKEVEGPKTEISKLVHATHPGKKTDYPVKKSGEFDEKTTKDKSRRADNQPGQDAADYKKSNLNIKEAVSSSGAKHILDKHSAHGDFFSLRHDSISALHHEAKKAGYRGSNNGASLARNFHSHLKKKAAKAD